MANAMWFVLAVAVAAVALAPLQTEAAMSCETVTTNLSPCISYVLSNGVAPPPTTCCQGITNLYTQAATTADRRTVCGCLKNVASSASPAIINNAAALPRKCGVNIPYKISPSTDCSTVR